MIGNILFRSCGKLLLRLMIVFIFSYGLGSAQSLTLVVDNQEVDINGTVLATIGIDSPQGQVGGSVELIGVEQFDILSQGRQQSVQIINGITTEKTSLELQLKPKENGSYTLGPARLSMQDGSQIDSNSVEIFVSGEKLFVNGAPQGWNPTPGVESSISDEDMAGAMNLNTSENTLGMDRIVQILPFHWSWIVIFFVGLWGLMQIKSKGLSGEKILPYSGSGYGTTKNASKTHNDEHGIDYIEKRVEPDFPQIDASEFNEQSYAWIVWYLGSLLDKDLTGATPTWLYQEIMLSELDEEKKNLLHHVVDTIKQGVFAGKQIDKESLLTHLEVLQHG